MIPARPNQLIQVIAALLLTVQRGEPRPRLTEWIGDLGSYPSTIAVSSNRLVYFDASDGIRCFDPHRGSSFVVDSGPATDLTISRNGDLLAFARGDPIFAIWILHVDPSTGRSLGPARRLSLHSGRAPAFSPDGKWVAFSVLPADDSTSGARVIRLPVFGGAEHVLTRERGFAQNLRWSPDGKWIYYRHGMMTAAGPHRTLHRVSVQGGRAQVLAFIGEFVGLSPDGRRLAYVTNLHYHRDPLPRTVVIADLNGRELRRFDLPPDAMPVAWGPGAEELLIPRTHERLMTSVHLADLNGEIRELTPDGDSAGEAPIYAFGDGHHVLLLSSNNGRSQLISLDLESGGRRLIFAEHMSNGALRWVGGDYVSNLADQFIRLIHIPSGRERALPDCQSLLSEVRSDSTVICYGRGLDTHTIRLIKLPSGVSTILRTLSVPDSMRPRVQLVHNETLILTVGGRILATPLHGGAMRPVYAVRDSEQLIVKEVGSSPDGLWLAAYSTARRSERSARAFIRIVPTRTGLVRSLPLPELRLNSAPVWDPANRYIAFDADDGPRSDVWIVPLDGQPAFPLTHSETESVGSFVLTADGNAVLYPVRKGSVPTTSLWTVDLSRLALAASTP